MRDREPGFNLIELLLALAVLSALVAGGLPPLFRAVADLRVRLAAGELAGALRTAKSFAVCHGANVAVKFRVAPGGRTTFAIYRDGNGNGVLNRDILSGADPEVARPRPLAQLGRDVRFGFPPGPLPRDPSGSPLAPGDPIRFNTSDLASFDPIGGATPGSLYLTDGRDRLTVVRVLGRTGRTRVLAYDRAARVWR